MPARQDIDPLDSPWALPRLSLFDSDPDTGFGYRLAGGVPQAAMTSRTEYIPIGEIR